MKHVGENNRLLAPMRRTDRERFVASCKSTELRFGDILYERGEAVKHAYFPLEGFVSLITVLDDGAELEVGIVGDEGMLGTSLVLGVEKSPQRAVVQGAGTALRIGAAAFHRHCAQSPELHVMLQRYIHVVLAQIAQTAACSRYHLIEARLARWLLLTRDRAHSDEFHLTHAFLAYMLGIRRAGVTQAARALQERGLIEYRRGDIALVDLAGLRKTSCPCYAGGKRIYEQSLNPAARGPSRRRAVRPH